MDELKERIENNSQQLKTLQQNERAKAKVSTVIIPYKRPHAYHRF